MTRLLVPPITVGTTCSPTNVGRGAVWLGAVLDEEHDSSWKKIPLSMSLGLFGCANPWILGTLGVCHLLHPNKQVNSHESNGLGLVFVSLFAGLGAQFSRSPLHCPHTCTPANHGLGVRGGEAWPQERAAGTI